MNIKYGFYAGWDVSKALVNFPWALVFVWGGTGLFCFETAKDSARWEKKRGGIL